jgi:hypothetical protein
MKQSQIYGLLEEEIDDNLANIESKPRSKKRKKKTKPAKSNRVPLVPEIKYSEVPGAENLPIDNLVDIPESLLRAVQESSQNFTKELSDAMLKQEAAFLMAFDSATAYTEAALRDGLGVSVEIDDDVLAVIANLNRLAVVRTYMRKLALPKATKKLFLDKLCEALVTESVADMKRAALGRSKSKYIQRLQELNGRVRRQEETPKAVSSKKRKDVKSDKPRNSNPLVSDDEIEVVVTPKAVMRRRHRQ